MASPSVHSTHLSPTHTFSKTYTPSITLIPGFGVQGDYHSSPTSKSNPSTPNLRQVHLIPYELFHTLSAQGFAIQAGELGENITTWGLDLVALPPGTYLYFGSGDAVAVVQVTGLRDPGPGVERHKRGLLEKMRYQDAGSGRIVRNCGIMGMVVGGGVVRQGDGIRVVMPEVRGELVPV